MFNFVKKIFTSPVTQSDIMKLEILEKALSAQEQIRDKMTDPEYRAKVDERVTETRDLFVKQLASMAKRGYLHNQI